MVALVGAAIDDEAPRSMTVFLEIPLDVVGVVVMRGILRRPSRRLSGSVIVLHLLKGQQLLLSTTGGRGYHNSISIP